MAIRKKHKTFILALEKDDPEKELDFELDFQATLTTWERLQRMVTSAAMLRKAWQRNGYRKARTILKRT